MEGKGRSCVNEDGIMDFRRRGLNNSFCVAPDEAYIDRYGFMRYNRPEPSDIISVRKIDNSMKTDSIVDITGRSSVNRHGGFNGFGAYPYDRP